MTDTSTVVGAVVRNFFPKAGWYSPSAVLGMQLSGVLGGCLLKELPADIFPLGGNIAMTVGGTYHCRLGETTYRFVPTGRIIQDKVGILLAEGYLRAPLTAKQAAEWEAIRLADHVRHQVAMVALRKRFSALRNL